MLPLEMVDPDHAVKNCSPFAFDMDHYFYLGNGEQRQAPHIPTRIDIGGETYIQTRPGVLIRSTATHTRTAAKYSIICWY